MQRNKSKHILKDKPLKANEEKVKTLKEFFKPSRFFPRANYYKHFQGLADLVISKHKEEDKAKASRRNAQVALGKEAYTLINAAKISDEEYAEYLYQLHSNYENYKSVRVTYDEFSRVLPDILAEWPQVKDTLQEMKTNWELLDLTVSERKQVVRDAIDHYTAMRRRYQEALKNPKMSQVTKDAARDAKTKSYANLQQAKERLTQSQHALFEYQNLKRVPQFFMEEFNYQHNMITFFINSILNAKKTLASLKSRENQKENVARQIKAAEADVESAESTFTNYMRIQRGKNERITDEIIAERIIKKIINQRVQDKFEQKKDRTYAGALLTIQSMIIDVDYKGKEDEASGNTMLGRRMNLGSVLVRGLYSVLANRKVMDQDTKSRMYRHIFLNKRDIQDCKALFREFVAKNRDQFKALPFQAIVNHAPIWKDEIVKKPALKKVHMDYELDSMKKYGLNEKEIQKYYTKKASREKHIKKGIFGTWFPRKDHSENVGDFIDRTPEEVNVYKKVKLGSYAQIMKGEKLVTVLDKPGKWQLDPNKKEQMIESERVLHLYNKTIADFTNIPRDFTLHTTNRKLRNPEKLAEIEQTVGEVNAKMETIRKKFESEDRVLPKNIPTNVKRLNLVEQIKNFDPKTLRHQVKPLSEKQYPAASKHADMNKDTYNNAKVATLAAIKMFHTYPAGHSKAEQVIQDPRKVKLVKEYGNDKANAKFGPTPRMKK